MTRNEAIELAISKFNEENNRLEQLIKTSVGDYMPMIIAGELKNNRKAIAILEGLKDDKEKE